MPQETRSVDVEEAVHPPSGRVPAHPLERGDGLASIAGGWAGSEELVRILEDSPRTGTREVDLD